MSTFDIVVRIFVISLALMRHFFLFCITHNIKIFLKVDFSAKQDIKRYPFFTPFRASELGTV